MEVQGRKLPGCAIWTYPDFEANYVEGYVATLPDSLDSRPRLRRAGYQSDAAEGTDLLNIRSDVDAVCAVLSARDVKPPLALGLFGNWGTGKSFFMAQMHDEIEALAKLERTQSRSDAVLQRDRPDPFQRVALLGRQLVGQPRGRDLQGLFEAVSGPAETSDAVRRRRASARRRAACSASRRWSSRKPSRSNPRRRGPAGEAERGTSSRNTLQGMYDQLAPVGRSSGHAGEPRRPRSSGR